MMWIFTFHRDRYTSQRNTTYLGPKRLHLSKGAGHGLAFWTHPVDYDEQIKEVLKENDLT